MVTNRVLAISTLLLGMAGSSFASLVAVGVLPSTGNGLGAVNSSLTFQNSGTESGCVAFNGTGAAVGSSVCPTGFTGGDEENVNSAGINIFTAADLGITFGGSRTFANLVLIFNGNEGGGPNQPVSVDSLGLTLYAADGTALTTFTTTGSQQYNALPGVGNAGFAYALDGPQSAAANLLLQNNPTLRIGTSANVSSADAGPETIQLSTVTTPLGGGGGTGGEVPEPASLALLGAGLAGLGFFGRRRS